MRCDSSPVCVRGRISRIEQQGLNVCADDVFFFGFGSFTVVIIVTYSVQDVHFCVLPPSLAVRLAAHRKLVFLLCVLLSSLITHCSLTACVRLDMCGVRVLASVCGCVRR